MGSLLMCGFLVRKRDRCLWCWVQAVMSCWSGAWEGWKGSVSVGCWVDVGKIWWSVVWEFWMEVELHCCGGFQVNEGEFGLVYWPWRGGEGCWVLGEVQGWIWRDFAGAGRSGLVERKRRKNSDFRGGRRRILLWDSHSLWCSLWLAKGAGRRS